MKTDPRVQIGVGDIDQQIDGHKDQRDKEHNALHDAVIALFALAGRLLPARAPFCLYGPFRIAGEFTSDSNQQFDASLKHRDPAMGIRDLEFLDELAARAAMTRTSLAAMPANNFMSVWRKMATAAD